MHSSTASINILKFQNHSRIKTSDVLAVEEPLEIKIEFLGASARESQSVSITMRTPGHDFELAIGFLLTEGLIRNADEIRNIQAQENLVRVELQDDVEFDFAKLQRHFYTTSSCGVCGKASLDAVRVQSQYLPDLLEKQNHEGPLFKSELIGHLPHLLREAQTLFETTGGLHASALFNSNGDVLALREDVGRHNALDKLIGDAVLHRQLPLADVLLMLSGRVSFELVQKATMAGVQIIAAVGAPSSLAYELAKEFNITLIGFVKSERFNIYHGDWRVL